MFLPETYSVAGFLLGVGILIIILDRSAGAYVGAAIAGIFFDLAAYFRAQFDQIMLVATELLIILFLFALANSHLL
ncbi:hypothetical protein [Microvirga sp. BSC39]|uniref:hypothetical protein n=1 Tax=Microvirga sp. BSC39 TaxID=1549810 RepID=UPI0012698C2B|nr:hypothetical protein [Microvirga sp. BSC39]